jgi:signal peptidase I
MAEESTLRNESIADAERDTPLDGVASSADLANSTTGGKRRFGAYTAIFVFLIFAAFVYANVHFVVVDGVSMLPTLKNGQRLTMSNAYWLIGPLKDNDIVVVRDSGKTGYIIKRIYKMAGETVDYANSPKDWSIANGKFVVPEGTVYVLGDNRDHSEDSRFFGPKKLTDVIGKVIRQP